MNKLTLYKLRCEYRENPPVIDVPNPHLSWMVKSETAATRQQAYRILVASSLQLLATDTGDFWDSGKLASEQSIDIVYTGKNLPSGVDCFWKVKIWDNHGNESCWSQVSQWRIGLLTPEDWRAQWIGLDHPAFGQLHDLKLFTPCYFRKEFQINKRKVTQAILYGSALGTYCFFLNGNRVGNDYFTPGWTDYRIRMYYNAYDVTALLEDGVNAIGGILSGGWYHWPDRGEKARLLGQLELRFQDGSRQIIATDDSWRASTGPEKYSHILLGEACDMRHDIRGWNLPGFDDSHWQIPQIGLELRKPFQEKYHIPAHPVLEAYPDEPVRQLRELRPHKVHTLIPRRVYIFDMGTNYAGFVRIKITNPKRGNIIRLRFGEWLNRDGTLYTANLRLAVNMADEYICAGEPEEIWEPRFTFRGHRYVELSGWPDAVPPGPDAVTGIELTQAVSESIRFSCGNPMLNKLFEALKQNRRANTIEAPTDCSQRDERQGWGGDALFFSKTAGYLADMQSFYRKWLIGILDAQHRDGGFARLAPSNHGYYVNDDDGLPGWADAGVIFPWILYQYYGDIEILANFFPAICRYIRFRLSTMHDYLPDETKFFYGDWNAIDTFWESKTSEWGADKYLTYAAFTAKTVKVASEIASVLGKECEAREFAEYFDKLKAAFNKKYVNENGMIHPSQGNCSFSITFGLLEPEIEKKVAKQLLEEFKNKNWRIGTGTASTPEVLFALSRSGLIEEAYNVLLNDSFPSWGYMIKHGATAIWEHWGSRRPELPDSALQFNPCDPKETAGPGFERHISPWMNSANHPALGAVGNWIIRNIGGINQMAPGFKKIAIRPFPDQRIAHAAVSYDSVYGTIVSEWSIVGDRLQMRIEIPANTSAQIYVPVSDSEHTLKISGGETIELLQTCAQYKIFEAQSGVYGFEFNWNSVNS